MHFDKFSFGSIQIDGKTYEKDVVIDRGEIRRRKKGPSKKFREELRTHAAFDRGKIAVELPPTCYRHRRLWELARDGRSGARSRTSQDQSAANADT